MKQDVKVTGLIESLHLQHNLELHWISLIQLDHPCILQV